MWSQQAALYSDFYQQHHHSQQQQQQRDAVALERGSHNLPSTPPLAGPGSEWFHPNTFLSQHPPYPHHVTGGVHPANGVIRHSGRAADPADSLVTTPTKLMTQLVTVKSELTPPKSDPGDDKPFSCMYPKCNYVTNRRNNLKRHHATMHERLNSPHYCCGNTYVRKADLRIHNKECHKEGYVCSWPNCGKSFLRKALMDRHMKIHTGEKPFVCSICQYGTSHKSNLDRHIKIHTKSALMGSECRELFPDMYESYKYSWTSQPETQLPTGNSSAAWAGSLISPEKMQFGQQCADTSNGSGQDSILPDSTTADLSPPPLVAGRNIDMLDHKYMHNYMEQLVPSAAAEKLLSSVGGSGFPTCDLSTISSILMSPLKSETDRETVDRWIREVDTSKEDFTSMTICRDFTKVSHTIDNILGSN